MHDVTSLLAVEAGPDARRTRPPSFADICCGVGGMRLAAERAGLRCVFACDADRACRDVYKDNFGELPHGNLFDIDPGSIPDNDIAFVGLPCQAYSGAGQRLGFRDGRGGDVFLGLLRLLRVRRPRVVVLENVAGLEDHDDGHTLLVIADCLRGLGYAVAWRVVDATEVGGCQHRPRIFIVASRGRHFDFARLQTKPPGRLADLLEPDVKAGWLDPAEYVLLDRPAPQASGLLFAGYLRGKSLRVQGGDRRLSRTHRQPNRIYSARGVFPTLSSREASGRHWVEVGGRVRKLARVECARLMGFMDTFRWTHPAHFYRQLGNSVYVPCVEALARAIREQLLEE